MPNPYVNKVIRSNGTTLIDISDSTAVASDVATGKYFYLATGEKVAGTGSSAPAATAHSIYFEYEDSTSESITAYYDSAFVTNTILSSSPKTHGGKTVTLAQLDGNTWYSYDPSAIPLNTQLIDYTKCLKDKMIDSEGEVTDKEWYYASDYTAVRSDMTFTYTVGYWTVIAFYDSTKAFISALQVSSDGTVDPDDSNLGHGSLSGSKLPSNVAYVRLSSVWPDSDYLSLIRTA